MYILIIYIDNQYGKSISTLFYNNDPMQNILIY